MIFSLPAFYRAAYKQLVCHVGKSQTTKTIFSYNKAELV